MFIAHITDIDWDIESEDLDIYEEDFPNVKAFNKAYIKEKKKVLKDLPTSVDIEYELKPDTEEILDNLSDNYGWLVDSLDITIEEK